MSRTSFRTTTSRAAALLLAAGLLAGCTGDEPDDHDAASAEPSAGASTGPVVIDGQEMTPMVEMTVPVPGHEEDEVTLGLVSLTASGSTSEMRLLMTPHFASDDGATTVDNISIYDMFGDDVWPELLDVERSTTYDTLGGIGGELETDVIKAQTSNDEPILYQAWFPRPEGEPETVDLWLHASWPPIEDVPVTYED